MRNAKAKIFMNIISRVKGNGEKIWQSINKLMGGKNKKDHRELEVKINNILLTSPIILATNLKKKYAHFLLHLFVLIIP